MWRVKLFESGFLCSLDGVSSTEVFGCASKPNRADAVHTSDKSCELVKLEYRSSRSSAGLLVTRSLVQIWLAKTRGRSQWCGMADRTVRKSIDYIGMSRTAKLCIAPVYQIIQLRL